MQPKKFSEYTPITETDGSEVIPILKAGVNATVKSEDLPISTATQTAIDAADADIAAHIADVANPHQVTKTQVGLGNADNTSDANKPVSTAQATAIALKADTTYVDSQDALKADQATTYTKTEVDTRDTAVADTAQANLTAHTSNTSNPHATTKSQVGLANADNTSDVDKPISAATQTALDAKASTTALDAHANSTANPHNVTKAQVGLGNADNTSDANKPVSTATQTALDAKANASDTVNLTGNQTVAGVKTFSSSPVVPTATTTTQAVNKAQMDAADALKVNKAGDTMTGTLTLPYASIVPTNANQGGAFGIKDTTTNTVWQMYALVSGNLAITNTTNWNYPFVIENGAAASMLRLMSDRIKTNGVDYISGTGFPEGVITAPVGSIYIDKAVTNGASSWIKKSGTGNTGWQVLEGDTGWRDITTSHTDSIFTKTGVDTGVQIKRNGEIIYLNIRATTKATGELLGVTLPTGFNNNKGATTSLLKLRDNTVIGQIYFETAVWQLSGGSIPVGTRVACNMAFPTTSSQWPTTLPGTAV